MRIEEAAAELRWFFSEARGDMGLRSNFSSIVSRIEGGEPTGMEPRVDLRRVEAATRARNVTKVLVRLKRRTLNILEAAFRVEGEPRLLLVMALVPEAVEEHRRSRSARMLGEWLLRLCNNAREGSDFERRRLFATIHSAAEKSLKGALGEFIAVERELTGGVLSPRARGPRGNGKAQHG